LLPRAWVEVKIGKEEKCERERFGVNQGEKKGVVARERREKEKRKGNHGRKRGERKKINKWKKGKKRKEERETIWLWN
jgi:hypothetical protein